ncbi:hypothetical protein GOBAR_DD29225 [Gossypium barbadense]|nr:hypothetical protein GOBAR_DD29225 [Gossypium barbadense]
MGGQSSRFRREKRLSCDLSSDQPQRDRCTRVRIFLGTRRRFLRSHLSRLGNFLRKFLNWRIFDIEKSKDRGTVLNEIVETSVRILVMKKSERVVRDSEVPTPVIAVDLVETEEVVGYRVTDSVARVEFPKRSFVVRRSGL